ncbi:hypothetical protein EGW08_016619 [Elysia chlorotica]|uniref:Cyclin C-terminal domain-containing protein n=1 Tax=Elysia chlorotica TaxID=188477 RepID=A0A433T247_ELYCH|nr:hypothetical protein EGW08_016619 [Elysia chlorotica]
MCLLRTKIMNLPDAIVTKLQHIMQQERAFYNQLNLKDLSQADFEHYLSVREKCVQYIKVPHIYFGAQADTFATAVAILDVFLWKIKNVPTAREIASLNSWTAKDLCRMELHVLERLGWHVGLVSYLSLLPILADAFGLSRDLVLSDSVVGLATRFLCRKSTVLFTPSTLAVALVQHIIGENVNSPAENQIGVHCNVEETQLVECIKLLSFLSDTDYASPPVSPPRLSPRFPLKIFDKPSMAGVTPLYTITEEPAAA